MGKKSTYLRKIMTAAWTIRRKERGTMSAALKKAWAWIKKAATTAPRLWSPNGEMFRVYQGDAYVQISVKRSRMSGYGMSHRICKGESFATGWVKAVGMNADAAMGLAEQFSRDIAHEFGGLGCNLDLLMSKF